MKLRNPEISCIFKEKKQPKYRTSYKEGTKSEIYCNNNKYLSFLNKKRKNPGDTSTKKKFDYNNEKINNKSKNTKNTKNSKTKIQKGNITVSKLTNLMNNYQKRFNQTKRSIFKISSKTKKILSQILKMYPKQKNNNSNIHQYNKYNNIIKYNN